MTRVRSSKIGKPSWKSPENTIPIRYDDPLYGSHFAERRFILIFMYFRGNYRRLVVTASYRPGFASSGWRNRIWTLMRFPLGTSLESTVTNSTRHYRRGKRISLAIKSLLKYLRNSCLRFDQNSPRRNWCRLPARRKKTERRVSLNAIRRRYVFNVPRVIPRDSNLLPVDSFI